MKPNCSVPVPPDLLEEVHRLGTATGGASVAVCTCAIAILLILKLHKKLSYRLALYQGLSSLLFGASAVGALLAFSAPPSVCKAFGFFLQATVLMKVFFVVCLTFHLFCFSVFHKNFMITWLEVVYVLCSVFIPLAMALVPFFTDSYGQSGGWCWIQNWHNNCPSEVDKIGEIEQFTLFYGIAFFILMIEVMAVVSMTAVLTWRACWRHHDSQQHREALKHLLPLIVYPVVFCLFFIIPFVNRLLMSKGELIPDLLYASAFFVPAWTLAAGTALLVHMIIILALTGKKKLKSLYGLKSVPKNFGSIEKEGNVTMNETTITVASSNDTCYLLPCDT